MAQVFQELDIEKWAPPAFFVLVDSVSRQI